MFEGCRTVGCLELFPRFIRIQVEDIRQCELTSPWSMKVADGVAHFYAIVSLKFLLQIDDSPNEMYFLKSGEMAFVLDGKRRQTAMTRNMPGFGVAGRIPTTGLSPHAAMFRGSFHWDKMKSLSPLPSCRWLYASRMKKGVWLPGDSKPCR
jgi:hypothetical protein